MMKADQLSTGPSFTDKLTHLYNGQGFVRASEYLLASSNGPMSCAMLLAIEVGNLKVTEHALGREPVDQMLIRTADILRDVFRGAVIGRLAVDRFRSDSIESWTKSKYRSKKIKPNTEGVVVCDESNSSSRF
jgi:GGDEF domain-containing protein